MKFGKSNIPKIYKFQEPLQKLSHLLFTHKDSFHHSQVPMYLYKLYNYENQQLLYNSRDINISYVFHPGSPSNFFV